MARISLVLALLAAAWGCSLIRAQGPAAGSRSSPAGEPAASGSAALRAPAFALVKLGMSASEVESAAGAPLAKASRGPAGTVEVWYYEGGVVILQDNQVKFSYAAPASQT